MNTTIVGLAVILVLVLAGIALISMPPSSPQSTTGNTVAASGSSPASQPAPSRPASAPVFTGGGCAR